MTEGVKTYNLSHNFGPAHTKLTKDYYDSKLDYRGADLSKINLTQFDGNTTDMTFK